MNPAFAGAAASLTLALGLAWLWRRRGWGDDPGAEPEGRKLQQAPVPAIGGLAIAGGWGVVSWMTGDWPGLPGGGGDIDGLRVWESLVSWTDLDGAVAFATPLALGIALASGMLDDLRRGGLGPLTKLLFQCLAGAVLVQHAPILTCLGVLVLLSVLHQNALNTFDNADGAATLVAGLGLLACGSPLAPAVLVFLIPNLLLRRSPTDPLAYLGDGGSQLLGMAVLLTPGAWPALVLPLLDIAAVCVERVRSGLPVWRGDRRHLAHRLQRRGLGSWAVLLVLLLIAAPPLCLPGAPGLLLSLAAYGVTYWWTQARAEPQTG